MTPEKLTLTEQDFISQGSHKKCFAYPGYKDRCIKIPYNAAGQIDLNREIHYLTHVLKKRGEQSGILPRYYGEVDTTLGAGHAFELIRDYDGAISQDIRGFLTASDVGALQLTALHDSLLNLRDRMLRYRVISMSIYPENILYQKLTESTFRLMLINDMGSGAALPLEYYVVPLAKAKIKRYWNRFVDSLATKANPAVTKIIVPGLKF